MITVEIDQTAKLTLDSKKIEKIYTQEQVSDAQHQIATRQCCSNHQKGKKKEQKLFSTPNLQYAYSQIALDSETKKQYNFSLIGGNAARNANFKQELYGLTDIPAEFQKTIELTITNCENTLAYRDDILIVTKRSRDTRKEQLNKIYRKLNDENFAIIHKILPSSQTTMLQSAQQHQAKIKD